MSERFDDVAKTVAERTPRRTALLGLGSLALGSLGILGVGQGSEAKKNHNHNQCNLCKQQCKRNNKKQGKQQLRDCNIKCNIKCNNTNK
jgi:hypothetical protein